MAIAAIALVMSACDWPSYRGSPGHTGFNAFETAISVSNVSTLTMAFSGSTSGLPSSPVEANGVLYVQTATKLLAFAAQGNTNCSGTPTTCQPLWTAALTNNSGGYPIGVPSVSNGVVYIVGQVGGVSSMNLYAYDAAGNTNCSGSPKVCQPLWEGLGGSSAPNVVNGVMYVSSDTGRGHRRLRRRGPHKPLGNPKVCQPLWTGVPTPSSASTTGSSPTVVNGVAYIASTGALYAFDASGATNCSGTPKVCMQLWAAPIATDSSPLSPTPAVDNGTVYMTNAGPLGGSSGPVLYAFDAAGNSNCSGSPKVCAPLWTASGASGSPAIAGGTVYVNGHGGIAAFDAAGNTNCSGSPKVCSPLWSYTAPNFGPFGSPVVANGVLYGTSGASSLGFGRMPGTLREPVNAQACPKCAPRSSRTRAMPS